MATSLITDTATLTGRMLRHITRSMDTIITTAVMPIGMMLLFVYVLGGAIDTGGSAGAAGSTDRSAYVDYMLPGILLITIASGVSYTAFRLFTDLQGGIVDRFATIPIARSAVLWSHVITSMLANLVSLLVVVGVALVIGFRSPAGVGAWLAVSGVLGLFTLALTWMAVIPGLTAKSTDSAVAFSYPLIFLPFISSAFVPTATMPGPVRWFAEHQPVTPIVNAIRDLLAQPAGGALSSGAADSDIWAALAWCAVVLVIASAAATLVYRRRVG